MERPVSDAAKPVSRSLIARLALSQNCRVSTILPSAQAGGFFLHVVALTR